ncbi:MAG: lipid II flippase MurJ, partial [Pseudolabrys sp.]
VMVIVLAVVVLPNQQIEQFYTIAWLAFSVSIAGLIQLVLTTTVWLSTGSRWQRAHTYTSGQAEAFFRRALPGLIATGIPQLKLIAATAIASISPAAVSWLYYANRLYELPLGVASVAIAAVIVPRIAASVHMKADDGAALAGAQSRAYEIAAGLALPAATGFALLAERIASGLFEHGAFGPQDSVAVAGALTAICIGLPGHVLEKVFGAVSFAHEDTHTPMLAALAGLITAIVMGILLFPRFGHIGVAGAIGISGWVGALLLNFTLHQRGWLHLDSLAKRRLPRIVFATIIMACIVAYATHAVGPAETMSSLGRLAILAVLVTLGIVVYLASLQLLGVMKLKELATAVRHRT